MSPPSQALRAELVPNLYPHSFGPALVKLPLWAKKRGNFEAKKHRPVKKGRFPEEL